MMLFTGMAFQSFSTVVVSSVGNDGSFQVENAFIMKKNDFEYKKSVVREMFKRFNIKIAFADIGYGNDIVPELQKEFQTRLWACNNSGTLINPIKVVEDELVVRVNKDLVLDDLFNAMRRGKILLPLGDARSYEMMAWLVEHICSMEKVTKTIAGNVVNKYVKGNTPNDGLLSLLYSYLAWKFFETRGFKTKPHQKNVSNNAPVLAYLPRL